MIYKSFGFDKFFDASYYNTGTSEDMAEYGLLDKPFFAQSQNLLSSLPQPFYTKLITVGNHYPYKMNQDLVTIDKANTEMQALIIISKQLVMQTKQSNRSSNN